MSEWVCAYRLKAARFCSAVSRGDRMEGTQEAPSVHSHADEPLPVVPWEERGSDIDLRERYPPRRLVTSQNLLEKKEAL